MRLVPIHWATQSTKAQSGVVSSERLVNCYLEVNPAGSKNPVAVYGDAGLASWTTIAETPIRGMLLFDSTHLFVVAGASLYVVAEDKTASLVGAVPGGGPVSMCANATHVGIATNLGLYAATTASIVMVDSNFYTSATYQDGLGVFTLVDSEQFYLSGVDDMTTVNPLDFSSADTFADEVRACISDHRELIVFGYETIEHYYNSGDPSFPFARAPGGFIEIGCVSGASVAKHKNMVFFLGNDGAVWSLSGYQPQRISTPGIERHIKEIGNPAASSAFCYSLEGHDHYVLNFINATLVYDITTGLWRERESFGAPRWRAQSYVHAWGLDLVADYETGDIHELSLDAYDENGEPLVRTMQSAPLHGGGVRVANPRLYIDAEMGMERPVASPATDFMLHWSDDGGKTWSYEVRASVGDVGEYKNRALFGPLGSFFQRTFRLSFSAPCKMVVIAAYAELEAFD